MFGDAHNRDKVIMQLLIVNKENSKNMCFFEEKKIN